MPQSLTRSMRLSEMAIAFGYNNAFTSKKTDFINNRAVISGFSENKAYFFTVPYFVLIKNELVNISF